MNITQYTYYSTVECSMHFDLAFNNLTSQFRHKMNRDRFLISLFLIHNKSRNPHLGRALMSNLEISHIQFLKFLKFHFLLWNHYHNAQQFVSLPIPYIYFQLARFSEKQIPKNISNIRNPYQSLPILLYLSKTKIRWLPKS